MEAMNLYFVRDRNNTVGLIVVAKGTEHAMRMIEDTGLDWTLGNTHIKRIQRRVKEDEGVIAGVCLRGTNQTPRTTGAYSDLNPANKARRREKQRRKKAERSDCVA